MAETISNSDLLLVEIDDSISKYDDEIVSKLLQKVPLEMLPRESSDSLLLFLIRSAINCNNLAVIGVIFENWNKVYPSDKISFFSYLFSEMWFPLDFLRFSARYFSTFTYIEIMADLMEMPSTSQTLLACRRIEYVYGEQTLNVYKELKENSKFNRDVFNFLTDKIREINEYAPIPYYIIPYSKDTNMTIPPIITDLGFDLPSDDQILNMVTSGIYDLGLMDEDIEKTIDDLYVKIKESTEQEKREMVSPYFLQKYRESLQNDIKLFQLMGPVHPLVNASVDELEHGGERMFFSQLFEQGEIEDPEEVAPPWFTGSCQFCDKRIRKKWYAVRRPLPFGGWEGCFCNWRCVIQFQYKYEGADILVTTFITKFEQKMKELGIQDRPK